MGQGPFSKVGTQPVNSGDTSTHVFASPKDALGSTAQLSETVASDQAPLQLPGSKLPPNLKEGIGQNTGVSRTNTTVSLAKRLVLEQSNNPTKMARRTPSPVGESQPLQEQDEEPECVSEMMPSSPSTLPNPSLLASEITEHSQISSAPTSPKVICDD